MKLIFNILLIVFTLIGFGFNCLVHKLIFHSYLPNNILEWVFCILLSIWFGGAMTLSVVVKEDDDGPGDWMHP